MKTKFFTEREVKQKLKKRERTAYSAGFKRGVDATYGCFSDMLTMLLGDKYGLNTEQLKEIEERICRLSENIVEGRISLDEVREAREEDYGGKGYGYRITPSMVLKLAEDGQYQVDENAVIRIAENNFIVFRRWPDDKEAPEDFEKYANCKDFESAMMAAHTQVRTIWQE